MQVGDLVQAGDPLVVIEAMKMEHTLKATATGVVQEMNVSVGARVKEGDVLVLVVAPDPPV